MNLPAQSVPGAVLDVDARGRADLLASRLPVGARSGKEPQSGLRDRLMSATISSQRCGAEVRPGVLKVAHNAKYDIQILTSYGVRVAPVDCTMLISYVLDAGRAAHGMDFLAERVLDHRTIHYGDGRQAGLCRAGGG